MSGVAITGGSGTLGRALIRELKTQGYKVRNFDLMPDGGLADHFERGDLMDVAKLTHWMTGSDAVIHLAAFPAPGIASPRWLTQINIMGTFYVLEAAATLKIQRVVLASSVSVLGLAWGKRFTPKYLPIDENHPLFPEDEYSVSKVINEEHGAMFARHYPMSIGMMRFPTIIHQDTLNKFRQRLIASPELAARLLWSYVDVEDAAIACRLAIEQVFTKAEAFYITAGDNLAQESLSTLLETYYPGVELMKGFDLNDSLISHEKAHRMLGYHPRHPWGHHRIVPSETQ